MIGFNLITHQTTDKGLLVKTVLVHEGVDIDQQIYLAFLHDRANQGLCCVSSTRGGMDIEEVAKQDPSAIRVHKINILDGFGPKDAEKVVDSLGLKGKTREQGIE
jgi:succinyl-CoA synthetase beta subunit